MKFLDMIRRAEEAQVLYTLQKRTIVAQTQMEALRDVAAETGETEQLEALNKQIELNQTRLNAVGTLAERMFGVTDEDGLLQIVDAVGAAMETHSKLRFETARLRNELELGAMVGRLTAEDRMSAETAIAHMTEEIQKIGEQMDKLFPKARLLLV